MELVRRLGEVGAVQLHGGFPAPGVFSRARVLPGTDPLPLPGLEDRPGAYGAVLEAALDDAAPADGVLSALAAATTIRPFGERSGWLTMVREQLAYRRRGR